MKADPPSGIVASDREDGRHRRIRVIADRALADSTNRSLRAFARADLSLYIGAVALLVAAGFAILLPPSPVAVVVAGVATIALAMDRRLGPLPAALLVVLTLPWARGADTLTYEVGGIPIRPHDVVIGVGMLASLPVLVRRRPVLNPMLVLIGVMLALGVVGVVVGLVLDNALRDVVRDVRWWAFYGAAILAMFGATTRAQLTRGLVVGMTLFAILIIVAAIAPVFPGGLKDQELLYDRGTLRMQFGNSAFLLPAIAYVAATFVRHPAIRNGLWLLLLLIGVVLSLTRISIAAAVLVVGMVYIVTLATDRTLIPSWLGRAAAGVRLGVVGVVALALGVALNIAGTPPPAQVATSGGTAGEQPLGRIFFQEERSGVLSFAARIIAYQAAAETIIKYPLTGAGMGSLTRADHSYNEARANTIGMAPSVDNAYLTMGLKAGIPGMVLFVAIMLTAFIAAVRRRGWLLRWYAPALVGLGALTMSQAFAVSLYGPFPLALLLALPFLRWGSSRAVAGPALTGPR